MVDEAFEARATCQRLASGTTRVCPKGPVVMGEGQGGDSVLVLPLPTPVALGKLLPSWASLLHL